MQNGTKGENEWPLLTAVYKIANVSSTSGIKKVGQTDICLDKTGDFFSASVIALFEQFAIQFAKHADLKNTEWCMNLSIKPADTPCAGPAGTEQEAFPDKNKKALLQKEENEYNVKKEHEKKDLQNCSSSFVLSPTFPLPLPPPPPPLLFGSSSFSSRFSSTSSSVSNFRNAKSKRTFVSKDLYPIVVSTNPSDLLVWLKECVENKLCKICFNCGFCHDNRILVLHFYLEPKSEIPIAFSIATWFKNTMVEGKLQDEKKMFLLLLTTDSLPKCVLALCNCRRMLKINLRRWPSSLEINQFYPISMFVSWFDLDPNSSQQSKKIEGDGFFLKMVKKFTKVPYFELNTLENIRTLTKAQNWNCTTKDEVARLELPELTSTHSNHKSESDDLFSLVAFLELRMLLVSLLMIEKILESVPRHQLYLSISEKVVGFFNTNYQTWKILKKERNLRYSLGDSS